MRIEIVRAVRAAEKYGPHVLSSAAVAVVLSTVTLMTINTGIRINSRDLLTF